MTSSSAVEGSIATVKRQRFETLPNIHAKSNLLHEAKISNFKQPETRTKSVTLLRPGKRSRNDGNNTDDDSRVQIKISRYVEATNFSMDKNNSC